MPATKLDVLATSYVAEQRKAWVDLVDLTLSVDAQNLDSVAESLAKHVRTTKYNLKRKMEAIWYAHSLGNDPERIKAIGQEDILGRYAKKVNADKYEQTTVMKWNLPGSLREVIREDMAAISKILGFKTSEQLWDFIHSLFVDLKNDPDSLKHLAGQLQPPKENHAPHKG